MLSNPLPPLSLTPPPTDVSQILESFSSFFQKAVSSHPKKPQILAQMNSFLGFLSNNRDDLSKGYQFLKEMKQTQNQAEIQKFEVALHYLKTTDSPYQSFKEITEFDILQEMKVFNCDPKFFSYDLLLLCVSVRFWDVLLSYIDSHQLNLLQTIKEKVFHDTLSQNVQEKIIGFFEKVEELARNDQGSSYKRAFAKLTAFEKPTEFLVTMIPVIKQIIIKFLINSEWNFVREKLQDKLNTNSLNQIFTLFKSQHNFPQKDPDVQLLEENTQNFLQILALGLNINIKILWNNNSLEGEKNVVTTKWFYAKNKDEALGNVSIFVIKNQNIWLYYNLYRSENWSLEENKKSTEIAENKDKKATENTEGKDKLEKFESLKHFNNFAKSASIRITEEMFPLHSINKQSQEETSLTLNKKKSFGNGNVAIKPGYLTDFLVNFQEKSEEIYSKVFNNEIENQDSQKINFKRYLSSEFEQKVDPDDPHFLSNNGKKPESSFSAGLRPQTNLNKMGFIQKCSKCPKEYVEYEAKKDNIYLCYVCR